MKIKAEEKQANNATNPPRGNSGTTIKLPALPVTAELERYSVSPWNSAFTG